MKIVVFNWKMNPPFLRGALRLAKASDAKNVVVAPPFVFLEEVGKILKKAQLAAQDLFYESPPTGGGAFTGEVSVKELKNLGVKYVIVGHSERRYKFGETDKIIAKKFKAALSGGLMPVLCVGEDLKIRRKGIAAAKKFVKDQLQKDLKEISSLVISRKSLVRNFVIAYEPVWAIGTGKSDTPQDAVEMIKFIKKLLTTNYKLPATKVLYGGSVDGKNIGDFLKYLEIDGALVGGASLKMKEVKGIIRVANEYSR